ncbi:MAG: hypothetical protein GY806_21325 [Gammaproteobacteria bacterium]|nr:hypothetical protein [Gammaproteobacteria bacterium]
MKYRYPTSTSNPGKNWLRLLASVLLCSSLAAGCAHIRKETYPEDFVYLEREQVTSQMAMLSLYMEQLDKILLDDKTVSSEQQQRVIAILSRIDASADSLGAASIRTNHLVLDAHIDQFKSSVHIAMRDASADPPNYFALGRLSGSCVACHRFH